MMFKRVKGMSVFRGFVYLFFALLAAGGLWLAYQPSAHSQISPATRPHTHSSQSSGGSTLAPALLGPSVVVTNPSDFSTALRIQGSVKGLRLGTSGTAGTIAAVDSTGSISFQPLLLNGTDITLGQTTTSTNVTLDSTGSLTSNKACATNYTRVAPNYCKAVPQVTQAWTNATACTDRTFTNALPADAKAVQIFVEWQSSSNNATGLRSNTATFSNAPAASSCPGASDTATSKMGTFEQVATIAGQVLGQMTDHLIVPLTGTNTFTAKQANAGGNGNAQINNYGALGYFD